MVEYCNNGGGYLKARWLVQYMVTMYLPPFNTYPEYHGSIYMNGMLPKALWVYGGVKAKAIIYN